MQDLDFGLVDAFTEKPFAGNQAGVLVLKESLSDQKMQAIAAELNFAETAFLQKEGEAYRLRWFAPKAEVELCGHATLAAAHYLKSTGMLPHASMVRFKTRSGLLTATFREGGSISLDFPSTKLSKIEVTQELIEVLGQRPLGVFQAGIDWLVELGDASFLKNVKLDPAKVLGLPPRGIILTSLSDNPEHDFLSRFFCPSIGIEEDPVTGAAHCALGPFWESRVGKAEMVGYQASQRGGVVKVRVNGDRCLLTGQAVTVLTGRFLV